MRVLVIGSNGQLGADLMEVLAGNAGLAVHGATYPDFDITDPLSVELVCGGFDPDVVFNCAAWTAVDAAEADEPAAMAVNGLGPRIVAQECRKAAALLVHVSTDYVFDGRGTTPYAEDAAPDPQSAYGRTKLAGERAVRELLPESSYIVRTAWLYGRHGANFVRTMARLEREQDTVDVVDDQVGQPTYSHDLAMQLVRLMERRPDYGIYHATNTGEVTWYGLAREVFRLLGADPDRVRPTTSAASSRPAPRPAYSVLGHERWERAGLPAMRDWREALEAAFADGVTDGVADG